MKGLLILGIFVLAAVGQDVEHAPTVAQCQADQGLWISELLDDTYPKPDIDVLQKWTREMRDCKKVDPEHKVDYYNTVGDIDSEELLRMVHFINRHNLLAEFKAEDAAGKR
jgi:hypothetical protein